MRSQRYTPPHEPGTTHGKKQKKTSPLFFTRLILWLRKLKLTSYFTVAGAADWTFQRLQVKSGNRLHQLRSEYGVRSLYLEIVKNSASSKCYRSEQKNRGKNNLSCAIYQNFDRDYLGI